MAQIHRALLEQIEQATRCSDENIDTACLAAAGRLVVFGTADGRLYRSRDAGTGWELALKGLPRVGCVALG